MCNDHVIAYYVEMWSRIGGVGRQGCVDWQGLFMDECERAEAHN